MKKNEVIPPSKELQRRMEILRQLPPPTLEQVRRSFKASAEFRARLTAKPGN